MPLTEQREAAEENDPDNDMLGSLVLEICRFQAPISYFIGDGEQTETGARDPGKTEHPGRFKDTRVDKGTRKWLE